MPIQLFSVAGGTEVYRGQAGVVILGIEFGWTANTIVISPTDNVNDASALTVATITAWTEDRIEFNLPTGAPSFEISYWFVKDEFGVSNLDGFRVVILSALLPGKPINYQGRDGELRFLDKTQAALGGAGTPWGIKVTFAQMDLVIGGRQPRPMSLMRINRERLSTDMHHQLGSEEELLKAFPIEFSFAISSLERDAIIEFVGIDWARKEGISTDNPVWSVKGTPSVGLVTTKGRKTLNDGLYIGGRIDGTGTLHKTPLFADKKKVTVDMEVLWSERNGVNRFGYRVQEIHFPPGEQRIAESPDLIVMKMKGMAYGMATSITSFTRMRNVLDNNIFPVG